MLSDDVVCPEECPFDKLVATLLGESGVWGAHCS
jgi:hypothetical protein